MRWRSVMELPLSVKISFGPALAIFALLISAVLVDLLIGDFTTKTRQIGQERFEVSSELLRASSDLNGTVMDLYYVLAAADSGQDAKASTDQLSNISQRLIAIKDRVSAVRQQVSDPATAATLDSVSEGLSKFEQPISFLKDMLDIDPKSALSFLEPLRDNLGQVQKSLAAIAEDQRAQASVVVNQLQSKGNQSRYGFLVVNGIIILVLGVMTLTLLRNLLHSIKQITKTTSALARGDLTVDIDRLARKDELGEIVKALSVFRDSLEATKRLQQEQELADQRADEQKRQAALALANELETSLQDLVQDLNSTVQQMEASATLLDDQSDLGRDEATKAVTAMGSADKNVQAVAGAAEELSSSFIEISKQVTEASSITRRSMDSVEVSTQKMAQLAEQADQIGNIIMLIRDIASQTNLLALNATIEAARAGDAGKGFAVVANEVKSLANQTAKATEEISNQISQMQAAANEATTAIDGVKVTVNQNVEVASAIAAAVEEQEAATREIARNIHQASEGTQKVSSNIDSLRGIVDHTRDASAELLASSAELGQETAKLRRTMAEVIARLRA